MTTVRVTLGLTIVALGFALAALAGIPALIENRSAGNVVAVVGFALTFAGLVLGATGIRAEVRAYALRKAADAADIANLKLRRRRIQNTKADVLVRLLEAKDELAYYAADTSRAAQAREQRKFVRGIELENLIIEADLQSTANEFARYGLSVEKFDNDPNA